MRSAGLAVLCSLLVVSAAASAQPAPAPDPSPAPPAPALEPESAPVLEPGSVHLVLFGADGAPLPEALVVLPDGTQAKTNADGALRIVLAPGNPVLQLHVGAAPTLIEGIVVVSGESTLVIANVEADGTLGGLDIQLPKSAQVAPEAQEQQVVTREPPGTVQGVAVSLEGGQPVVGAKVYVRGLPMEVLTGADGSFTLEVPAGAQRLSLIHTAFSTQTADVTVISGELVSVRVEMSPAAAELEDFVVTAPYIQGGVASVMAERRSSAAVSDSVGAEDIARMPASSAAQAAQRVVGATIVGGRYVYVRGLGERYTNALLNGAPLPSPEPDRSTVPLDLFPAQILESLDISKTFTPDMPADFAGGSVRIVTRSVPEKPLFAASLSTGFNSESTFREGYGQRSGSTDFLGFDDGGRALSSAIPRDYQLALGARRPDGEIVLPAELNERGLDINSNMAVERMTNLPNMSGSLAWGDGLRIDDDKRVGVLTSLVYSRNFVRRQLTRREYQADMTSPGGLGPWLGYEVDRMSEEVRWGAFASSTLELTKAHKITLLGMRSQLADARTNVYEGFRRNEMADIGGSRMEFVSRALTLGQLHGSHKLSSLNDAELDWRVALGLAERDEPDTRDVVFAAQVGEPYKYFDSVESGRHFFADMAEDSRTFGLDWTQPITDGDVATRLKAGTLITLRDREFGARRFALRPAPRAPNEPLICGERFDPIRCPRELFTEENIGPVLRLAQGGGEGDWYRAGLHVYAAYLMGDLALGENWRFLAGARLEATEQEITPFDPFTGMDIDRITNRLVSQDVLPAASVVYSPIEDLNVRLAVSRTLARPQLRELAPFAFSDYFGGAQQAGNPNLKLTKILNADLRVEYFPTPREVLAISVFGKSFVDPIEPVLRPASTNYTLTYENARGATVIGVELEARKTLEFISEVLSDFTLIASLMVADSSIRIVQTSTGFLTNTERPLVHAAPYVINFAIDYENKDRTQVRLLYNVSGPRVAEVGVDGLDDSYAHPVHLVDVSASQGFGEHWRLRLTGQNLLDATTLVTIGKRDRGYNTTNAFKEGVSASIGVSYTH